MNSACRLENFTLGLRFHPFYQRRVSDPVQRRTAGGASRPGDPFSSAAAPRGPSRRSFQASPAVTAGGLQHLFGGFGWQIVFCFHANAATPALAADLSSERGAGGE